MARLEDELRRLLESGGSTELEDVQREAVHARAWLQEGAAAAAAVEPALVALVLEWVWPSSPACPPPSALDLALYPRPLPSALCPRPRPSPIPTLALTPAPGA